MSDRRTARRRHRTTGAPLPIENAAGFPAAPAAATPSGPASDGMASALRRTRRAEVPPVGMTETALAVAPARWHRPSVAEALLLLTAALIVAVAVGARFWNLGLAPFHNDEGVNGYFVTTLARTGVWHYDPANYHGPTLFYAALLSTTLFGLSEVGLRLVPALFGTGVLLLVPLLRRYIGGAGALAALLLLAVSPGMVFFSRDIIHEMLLVFFTLAFVICLIRWWEDGRAILLVLAAAAAAAMFATKETAILTFVVLGLALVCLKVYEQLAPRLGRPLAWQTPEPGGVRRRRPGPADPYARFGGPGRLAQALTLAGLVFALIWLVLFSSFFSNFPQGIVDSFSSLSIWSQTSGATQISGPLTYLDWMSHEELPILVFGGISALFVIWEGRSRFAIFTAAWAIGLFAAYSLIGYKTPWLMLEWVLPFAILDGYVFGRAWAARSRLVHVAVPGVLAAGLAFSGIQAGFLAFHDYDNDAVNSYVYVPTKQDALRLVNWVRAEDAKLDAHGQMGVVIMSPEYWPLPWYFRNDAKAGFYGQIVDVAAPVQIVRADQVASLSATFTAKYVKVGQYNLRGAVNLVVYLDRADQ